MILTLLMNNTEYNTVSNIIEVVMEYCLCPIHLHEVNGKGPIWTPMCSQEIRN